MTARRPCPPAPGPLEDYAARFDVAVFEAGSGADEGDDVGCVHGPPACLGGLDEPFAGPRPPCGGMGRSQR